MPGERESKWGEKYVIHSGKETAADEAELIGEIEKLPLDKLHEAPPQVLEMLRMARDRGNLDDLVEEINKHRPERNKVSIKQIEDLLGEADKTKMRKLAEKWPNRDLQQASPRTPHLKKEKGGE